MLLWFSSRFVYMAPPPGEAPKENLDHARGIAEDLKPVVDSSMNEFEANTKRTVEARRERIVSDWMKTESADSAARTDIENFSKVDRDDYILYRLVTSRLKGVSQKDLLADGKPDTSSLRSALQDDNEEGDVAQALGFYWSGSDWAVVESGGEDDENRPESGGFYKTFKYTLLPLLREFSKDEDNPLDKDAVNRMASDVEEYAREYDLLSSKKPEGLTEDDKKLDVVKDDGRKIVDFVRSSKEDFVPLSPELLSLAQKHFLDNVSSYRFRFVQKGGEAFLYALRFTDEKDLPRLRVVKLGKLSQDTNDPTKPAEAGASDFAFLNAAAWERETYSDEEAVKGKLAELVSDLPKEVMEKDRVKELLQGEMTLQKAREISKDVLANETDFQYGFGDNGAALLTSLSDRLDKKLAAKYPDIMTTDQRKKIVEFRAPELVEAARLAILRYEGGILVDTIGSDEERKNLHIDFSFDTAEGVKVDPKGPAVLEFMRKTRELREKGVAKVKDVTQDIEAIKGTMLGGFLFDAIFDGDEAQLKKALTGEDFFGSIALGIFGLGKGKKTVKSFSQKHPQLASFLDSAKQSITQATNGLVAFYEHADKATVARMLSAGKKFEKDTELSDATTLNRELRAKFTPGEDMTLTINGRVELFEEGNIYNDVTLPVGTVLPEKTVVFKDSEPIQQVAQTNTQTASASSHTSS